MSSTTRGDQNDRVTLFDFIILLLGGMSLAAVLASTAILGGPLLQVGASYVLALIHLRIFYWLQKRVFGNPHKRIFLRLGTLWYLLLTIMVSNQMQSVEWFPSLSLPGLAFPAGWVILCGALWIGAIHWLGMPEYSPFLRAGDDNAK